MSKKSQYDKETGRPVDKSYLECGLPDFMMESIKRLKASTIKHDNGEPSDWDCDYCEVQSNINILEVGQCITSEQAWFLREKYLGIKKGEEI